MIEAGLQWKGLNIVNVARHPLALCGKKSQAVSLLYHEVMPCFLWPSSQFKRKHLEQLLYDEQPQPKREHATCVLLQKPKETPIAMFSEIALSGIECSGLF